MDLEIPRSAPAYPPPHTPPPPFDTPSTNLVPTTMPQVRKTLSEFHVHILTIVCSSWKGAPIASTSRLNYATILGSLIASRVIPVGNSQESNHIKLYIIFY